MSPRKQQPQEKLPEVSFDEFLKSVDSGRFSGEHENIANGPASDPDALIGLDTQNAFGPDDSFWQDGETVFDSLPGESAIKAPVGYPLNQALSKSPYLRLAARLLHTHPNVVVVSNGFRYWTANVNTFEPMLVEYNPDNQLSYQDWEPVYGDDRGLYMGERK